MPLVPYEFDAERFSRWMAYVLRHNPTRYGLQPDQHGYVSLEEFLTIARRRYPQTTPATLRGLIEGGAGRFEISGDRLRARYGHSIPVQPAGAPVQPPAHLYYGIDQQAIAVALRNGLMPTDRQFLHLSGTPEEALAIIRKKSSQPAVLHVDAASASAAGVRFYREGNVHLAPRLPAVYLKQVAEASRSSEPNA